MMTRECSSHTSSPLPLNHIPEVHFLKPSSFPPREQTCEPQSVLLTCRVSPAAWPRYRVQRALDVGQYNLEISNAELSDDSLYECQATEAALRSRRAKLNVLSKFQPVNRRKRTGDGRRSSESLTL